ncbi:hypothetical protein OC846_000784 [Tilletia horrida]|uniref:Uncharacterized protein n=1 Tax=Tilletia horrida TaxID=155126 RepID=A0AAN6H042_9BASI|nr:hypothetical protein OC846_000784 [Tilletia horrida]
MAFRLHLNSLIRTSARFLPESDLFDPLPSHPDSFESDLLTSTDDTILLSIRKEQVHVDQRLGPLIIDWADNESLLEIMRPANARSRPPYVRTPSHLLHHQHHEQHSGDDANALDLAHGSAAATNSTGIHSLPSASTSSSHAQPGPSIVTATATASSSTGGTTSAERRPPPTVYTEAPIPVARYSQQSTFSTEDVSDLSGPDRSAAVSTQVGSSSYSIGRTHVAFGIVHLFRDQFEADEATAQESREEFPSLGQSSPATDAASSSTPSTSKTQLPPTAAGSTLDKSPPMPQGAVQVTTDEESGSILGILAVPGYMTAADFLAFIEPAADAISHIRMIREVATDKCMVLIKFRDPFDAEEFHKMFNGQPFNAINEDELCQVVYITSVTVSASYSLPHAYPLLANSDPWPMLPPSSNSSLTAVTPVPSSSPNSAALAASGKAGHTASSSTSMTPSGTGVGTSLERDRIAAQLTYELPTCPVCLERMDSNVTGLMTVTCQHTFHCTCLSKWIDSRCPVCRYSQTRLRNGASNSLLAGTSSSANTRCTICQTTTDLWVCLICASVGCGRYKAGHAQQHFQETGHLYSLELETQRVWDYAGDGYVHRLIQNKTDGKLVELPSSSSVHSTPARGGGKGRSVSRGRGSTPLDDLSFSAADGEGDGGVAAGKDSLMMMGSSADTYAEDKVESLGLEYSYLIVSQLESQRAFYEEQVKLAQSQLEASQASYQDLQDSLAQAKGKVDELQSGLSEAERTRLALAQERDKADKRTEKAMELMRKMERDLHTERSHTEGLMKNIAQLRELRAQVEAELGAVKLELADVKEQMRDLMFFVSARDKIEGNEELVGGDTLVPASANKAGTSGSGAAAAPAAKKKKKKKPPAAVVAQLAAQQRQSQQGEGWDEEGGSGPDGGETEGNGQ